jgi:sulfite exporter TauE/SafE
MVMMMLLTLTDAQLWTSVLFVYWPGFVLGFLHSCVPCYDRTMFVFYAFGVSRETKDAFRIIGSYSSGTLLSNMFIGTIITTVGGLILKKLDPLISNQIGALVMVAAGIYLLVQLFRGKVQPHSRQNGGIVRKFQENGENKRTQTGFFLGILAGLTPCMFEIAVFTYAAGIGIGNGLILIAFYAFGALIGLFPYALFGVHRIRKGKSPKRTKLRLGVVQVSKIEVASVILLLIIGILLFSFAYAGVNLFGTVFTQA